MQQRIQSARDRAQSNPSPADQRPAGRIRVEDVLRLIPNLLPQNAPFDNDYGGRVQDRRRDRFQSPGTSGYDTPPPPPRTVPSSAQFASVSWQQQRQLLRAAILSLDEELSVTRAGTGWKKYLHLQMLRSEFSSDSALDPDAATRNRLQDIADEFDDLSRDPKYRSITDAWGFRTLLVGLHELSRTPAERSRHRLVASSATLRRALDQSHAGAGWTRYFRLDELDSLGSMEMLEMADLERLKEILVRFDHANQHPKYAAVTRLSGFRTTREHLDQLLNHVAAIPAYRAVQPGDVVGLIPQPEPPSREQTGVSLDRAGLNPQPELP